MDVGERTVAGWVLEKRLGAGGFGQVWQARRRHVGLPRALKVLPVRDQRAFTSWRHEIDRLEELSHPHIVRFYDADIVADPASPYDGFAWIATELCQGSLADELDARPDRVLSDDEGRLLVDQMLDALAAAHGRSCVHRDVKPANILWHASGLWKLADFGTARLVPDGAAQAQTTVVGTLPYMSPAAHRGRQDYAADLYALGVTVHEALCGEWLHPRPRDMSDSEHIKLILDTPPRVSPRLSTQWQTVVGALTGAYGPHDAGELLEWFRQTGGSTPPPPSSPRSLSPTAPAVTTGPLLPTAPVAAGSPEWWGDADVPDTNVERTQHHSPDPSRTARYPGRSNPPTLPQGRRRRRRGGGRRGGRDVPTGPIVVFGVSALVAGGLLLAAGLNPPIVIGVVGGAVLMIVLAMALN